MKKLVTTLLFLFFLHLGALSAANLYWIGGSGNWSDTSHWSTSSGGTSCLCLPTENDNVFFDANSFPSTNQTITLDSNAFCKDMNWTGVANSPSFDGVAILEIYGSLILSPNLNNSFSGEIIFKSIAGSVLLDTKGGVLSSNITIEVSDTLTIIDTLQMPFNNIYLMKGVVNATNNYISIAHISKYGIDTCILNLGSSMLETEYGFNFSDTTLFLNAGTSIIKVTGGFNSCNLGKKNVHNINFVNNNIYNFLEGFDAQVNNLVVEGSIRLQLDNSSINTLTLDGDAEIRGKNIVNNLNLSKGNVYYLLDTAAITIIGNLNAVGTCAKPIDILCLDGIASLIKVSDTLRVYHCNLQGIHASGGAFFEAINSIDLGGLAGWSITNPTIQTLYWINDGGNWSDSSHWSATSGGSPVGCIPNKFTNVVFDSNSFSLLNEVVNIDRDIYCNTMDWSAANDFPSFQGYSNSINIWGSLSFVSNLNLNNNYCRFFLKSNALGNTILTDGKEINNSIIFDGAGGSWTLQDSIIVVNNLELKQGVLNTNGNFVSAGYLLSQGNQQRTLNLSSSTIECFQVELINSNLIVLPGTSFVKFNFNNGYCNLQNVALNNVLFSDQFTTSYLNLNDAQVNNVVFNGDANIESVKGKFNNLTIFGNSEFLGSSRFNNLQLGEGKTCELNVGDTQTVTGSLIGNGNCVEPSIIRSINGISTILKTTDSVSLNYVQLQNINGTGGARFKAYNALDNGGNSGWAFQSPVIQTFYWINNEGNWNDPSHWSLSSGGAPVNCIPTAFVNVIFDSNSFDSAGQYVFLSDDSYCRNMDWTASQNAPSLIGSSNLYINGSLAFSPIIDLFYFTGNLNFISKDTGNTIFTAGKFLNSNFYFNDVNGGWRLLDNIVAPLNKLYLENGRLNTNDQEVWVNSFISIGNGIRNLSLGTSDLNIGYLFTGGLDVLDTVNLSGSNLTVDAGSSRIILNGNYNYLNLENVALNSVQFIDSTLFSNNEINGNSFFINQAIFNGSGVINSSNATFENVGFKDQGVLNGANNYGNLEFLANGTFTGSNTIENLYLSSGFTYYFLDGETQQFLNHIEGIGSCSEPINILGLGGVSRFLMNSGTVNLNQVKVLNMDASGGSNFTAFNSQDLGGNNGFTFQLTKEFPNVYYWINNGGEWSDTSHWSHSSGGCNVSTLPTQFANVVFDSFSFTKPDQKVVSNTTSVCKDMVWTGVNYEPSIGGFFGNSLISIYGSLTLSPTMNLYSNISFNANTSSNSIRTFGIPIIGNLIFNGVGGVWTLRDSLNLPKDFSNNSIILENGTLNTNSNFISVNKFQSIGNGTRTLNLGASVIEVTCDNCNNGLSGNNAVDLIDSNLVVNPGTSIFRFTGNEAGCNLGPIVLNDIEFTDSSASSNSGIHGNPTSIRNVSFKSNASIDVLSCDFNNVNLEGDAFIYGSNEFNNLSLKSGKQYNFADGDTQTFVGNLSANGTCDQSVELLSDNGITYFNKASGTITTNYITLKNIRAIGSANFIANNSQDLGGNLGWNLTAPTTQTYYWVNNGGNWSSPNHWATSSGGFPSGCLPTAIDNVIFDSNSFTISNQTVLVDATTSCRDIKWLSVKNQPTFSGNNNLDVFGSLILSPFMKNEFEGTISFKGKDSVFQIATGGNKIGSIVIFSGQNATWALQDSLVIEHDVNFVFLWHQEGIINTNNNFINVDYLESSGSANRVLNLGSSTIQGQAFYLGDANLVVNAGTSTLKLTKPFSYCELAGPITLNNILFADSSLSSNVSLFGIADSVNNIVFNGKGSLDLNGTSINSVEFKGDGEISGQNSFNRLKFSAGKYYQLRDSAVLTIRDSLLAYGAADKIITIMDSSNFSTFNKTGGTVCLQYVRMKNIHAIGGADFFAGNSLDSGNNVGWQFQTCGGCIPPPIPIITGKTSVCSNSIASYTTPNNVGRTYLWRVMGGAIISGQGTNSVNILWNGAGSGELEVTDSVNVTGCKANSALFTVAISSSPNPVISGPDFICVNSTATYSTPFNSGRTYQWSITGGTIISGQGTSSIQVNWATVGSGLLLVSDSINSLGCKVVSNTFIITINALPDPVISGNNNVCENASITYSIAANTGRTYIWSVTGGNIISGQGTNSIFVNWATPGLGTLLVSDSNNATGCRSLSTLFNVAINPNPAPIISGPNSVCTDGISAYSTPSNPNRIYRWLVIGGALVSGQGTANINVNWTGTGTGFVTLTDSNTISGCFTTSASYSVTKVANPIASISGPVIACPNTNASYNTVFNSGRIYKWVVSGGAIISGQGTANITVTWGAAGTGTLLLTDSIAASGCKATTSPYLVNINENNTPFVSGFTVNKLIQCERNNAFIFTDTTTITGTTRLWEFGNGNLGTEIQEAQNYVFGTTNYFEVKLRLSLGSCVSIATQRIYLIPNPSGKTISGNSAVKRLDLVSYSIPNTSGSSYQWFFENGIGTSKSNSINIRWTVKGSTILKVVERNASGCFGDTNTLAITIDGATGEQELDIEEINAFPNPVDNRLFVNLPTGMTVQLKMFDALGKEHINLSTIGNAQINTENLTPGIYFLWVQTENNQTYRLKVEVRR